MRMPELKALARERRLRGYSQLRKPALIELLWERKVRPQQQPMRAAQEPLSSTSQGSQQQAPTTEQEPLTKRQCKHRRAKYTKSAKKFTNLNSQINTMKL